MRACAAGLCETRRSTCLHSLVDSQKNVRTTTTSASRHKTNTQYMQEKDLGELIFARIHAGPVFALARIQENILENNFPHIRQILERIHFGANTCRACTDTRANTENNSWRIIYVLVSCQGALLKKYRNKPPICIAIRLHFALQCLQCPYARRKGKYCQYPSHLYRSTPRVAPSTG